VWDRTKPSVVIIWEMLTKTEVLLEVTPCHAASHPVRIVFSKTPFFILHSLHLCSYCMGKHTTVDSDAACSSPPRTDLPEVSMYLFKPCVPQMPPRLLLWSFLCSYTRLSNNFVYRNIKNLLCYILLYALWSTISSAPARTPKRTVDCSTLLWPNTVNNHSLTHSLTPSLTHSLTPLTHSLTPSPTHSLPRSLTHSLTHSLPLSLTHSISHSLTHSHLLPLTHSLAHSLTSSLTHSLHLSLTHSISHSLTHTFCHSLTPSLTHSLPLSLTHSISHSLTHTQIQIEHYFYFSLYLHLFELRMLPITCHMLLTWLGCHICHAPLPKQCNQLWECTEMDNNRYRSIINCNKRTGEHITLYPKETLQPSNVIITEYYR